MPVANNNSGITQQQQVILDAEARRRVQIALRQIEDAQNQLSAACSTLSSLCYARPEWNATSKLYERVKEHWYKVQGALQYGPKAAKVALDSTNADALLRRLAEAEGSQPGVDAK